MGKSSLHVQRFQYSAGARSTSMVFHLPQSNPSAAPIFVHHDLAARPHRTMAATRRQLHTPSAGSKPATICISSVRRHPEPATHETHQQARMSSTATIDPSAASPPSPTLPATAARRRRATPGQHLRPNPASLLTCHAVQHHAHDPSDKPIRSRCITASSIAPSPQNCKHPDEASKVMSTLSPNLASTFHPMASPCRTHYRPPNTQQPQQPTIITWDRSDGHTPNASASVVRLPNRQPPIFPFDQPSAAPPQLGRNP
ncbi:hypothetical protein ACLOJK_008547 [Asimina triloba]